MVSVSSFLLANGSLPTAKRKSLIQMVDQIKQEQI